MSVQPWSISRLLTLSFLLGVSSVSAGDPERVPIQTLFSPRVLSYQQHAVTVEGVIQDLQMRSPFESAQCLLLWSSCLPPRR